MDIVRKKINTYLSIADQDFFKLLRAGLKQESPEQLSNAPDWDYIYTLATQQTVQGIIADGISVMNLQGTLPDAIREKFQEDAVYIIRRNNEINVLQNRICKILDNNNIKHHVVKGQEAAQNYPNPFLRCAGDIDILLPPEDYEKAKPILQTIADSEQDEPQNRLHKGYLFGDVEVELHGALNPRLGEQIDNVMDEAQNDFFNNKINFVTFHTLFIFLHIIQHFCEGALGLRQIVDLEMQLLKCYDEIDFSILNSYIRKMNLKREWKNFQSFADYIVDSTLPATSSLNLSIWKECRQSGNMGRLRKVREREGGFFKRNAVSFNIILSRYFQTRNIIPTASRIVLKKEAILYWNVFLAKTGITK